MTSPPEFPDGQGQGGHDTASDTGRSRRWRRSTAAVVGPSDVGDDVKEVLRAAFDGPGAHDPGVHEVVPSDHRRRATASPSLILDPTGPLDFFEEQTQADPIPPPQRPKRRRFRDIVLDHDTRIKKRSEGADRAPIDNAVAARRDGDETEAPEEAPKDDFVYKVSEDGKKRVVISDDDVDGAANSEPKEERQRKKTRRRASQGVTRLPNRRWWTRTADGRWRLRWYSVVAVVAGGLVVVFLILTSPLLSIRSIVVEGNAYTSQTRLDEVLNGLKGDAILTADLHGATKQLEAIPWVRQARISMHLPTRVVVQLEERVPAAFFRAVDGFIRVLDGEGRILDIIEGDPVEYVRIIGSGPNLVPGDFVGQPFLGAVELVGALPATLRDRLVSATVSPEGEISLQLSPNLLIIFGQPNDFQVKLVAVVNEIKRQGNRSYTVIDVSTGEPNVR